MPGFVDRVANRAATIRLLRVLLTLLALPFYILGYTVGFLIVAARWMYGAAAVGIDDARGRKPEGR